MLNRRAANHGRARKLGGKPHIINKEVFRYFLIVLLVKATEHVLNHCLGLNFDPLSNCYAPANLLRLVAKDCDIIIMYVQLSLAQDLVVLCEILLKRACDIEKHRFVTS